MSNPVSIVNGYVAAIIGLIENLERARTFNDMIEQDATIITRYFQSPNARTDIEAVDVNNAHDALVQMLFSFDSGAPTQKSYLFKMQP